MIEDSLELLQSRASKVRFEKSVSPIVAKMFYELGVEMRICSHNTAELEAHNAKFEGLVSAIERMIRDYGTEITAEPIAETQPVEQP